MHKLVALCGGVFATFWLLVFMASLIVMKPIGNPTRGPTIFDGNVPREYQEPTKKIRPTLPKKETDTKPMPKVGITPSPTDRGTTVTLPPGDRILPPDWKQPREDTTWTRTTITETNAVGESAGAMPVAQIPPQFPRDLAQQGIEGWVKLRFMVNEVGEPFNVIVVDAKPKNVFNQAALNAVKKWRYRPALNDGVAVISGTQEIVLDFKLEKE